MPESSLLEQPERSSNRDFSLFLPFISGFANDSADDPDPGTGSRTREQERATASNGGVDDLLREVSSKSGPRPATEASIEAIRKIDVTEEERDGECPICLDEWEIGGEAREMPCKHRYHSDCITRWLRIRGCCPVCRFNMPADEEEQGKKRDSSGDSGNEDEEALETRIQRVIWVRFSSNNDNNSDGRDSNTAHSPSDSDDSVSTPRPDLEAAVDGSSNASYGEFRE